MMDFLRKMYRLLFNRNALFIIIIILQIVVLGLMVTVLSQHSLLITLLLMGLDLVLVVYICNTSENPSYKIPWLIAILVVPLLAGIAYLVVKTDLGHRIFKRNYAEKMKETKKYLPQNPEVMEALQETAPGQAGLARYLKDFGEYPVYRHTTTEYYADGEVMFEAMLREMEKAQRYIFMEFYIISEGEMWERTLSLLKEKAAQGIEVRLMYDGFGTEYLMPLGYFDRLKEFGIECKVFNSFKPFLSSSQNNRDHRKILVIDGKAAFTGGINLSDEYINRKERFGHWKDGGILCRGEAAWSFTVMFLQMWYLEKKGEDFLEYKPEGEMPKEDDGFVQPYCDSPTDEEYIGRNVYLDIINHAQKYIYVTTPYLALDHEMVTALGLAAKKGVDVRLMTPHIPDKWFAYSVAWGYYRELLAENVKIFEYEPGFVHAKTFFADDNIGVAGTINLDYRSFYLQYECAAVLYESDTIKDMRKDFEGTLHECIEIKMEDCLHRSLPKRLASWVLRIFAPLL